MNAGLLRRGISLFVDFIFMAALVSTLFNIAARPIYQNQIENFEEHYTKFVELQEEKGEKLEALNDEEFELVRDESISEEERDARLEEIQEDREALDAYYSYVNYPDAYRVGDGYIIFTAVYHLTGFLFAHTVYMLLMKGHSFGRRLTKLKLSGNINILSLLLRELFWKYLFWIFTLGIGIFIDIYMNLLTNSRKTIRDYFSGTRVVLNDIEYPF